MNVAIIYNPVAGSGLGQHRFMQCQQVLRGHFPHLQSFETRHIGQGSELAFCAAEAGADYVIACGGDGTISEVMSGLLHFQARYKRRVVLGVIPAGMGSDFAHMLDISFDIDKLVAALMRGATRQIDVLKLSIKGQDRPHYSLNIASLGLSAHTLHVGKNSHLKAVLNSRLYYIWHVLRGFLSFTSPHLRITIDGKPFYEGGITLVALANGRFFGGGMMIAPKADLTDGLIDVIVLKAASRLTLIAKMQLLYGGRHLNDKRIVSGRGKLVHIEPIGEAIAQIEADGETCGEGLLTARILPQAVTLLEQ